MSDPTLEKSRFRELKKYHQEYEKGRKSPIQILKKVQSDSDGTTIITPPMSPASSARGTPRVAASPAPSQPTTTTEVSEQTQPAATPLAHSSKPEKSPSRSSKAAKVSEATIKKIEGIITCPVTFRYFERRALRTYGRR